jgi:hypothetical protein
VWYEVKLCKGWYEVELRVNSEKQNSNNVPYPWFKLGVGRHQIELRVNGDPVLETGEIQNTRHQEKQKRNSFPYP